MDDEFQPRQVDPARCDIGRDADPRPAIAQRLQRVHPFLLAEFTRERHDLEATVHHAREKVVHIRPRLAEDDGGFRLVKAQEVEDRMFAVALGDRERAVFDIDMLLRFALGDDAGGIALEVAGERFDFLWHGGREHQGAAVFGRGREDEFKVFGKAEVEHFIGFVQHDGTAGREVERAAFDMVAQAARRAHDDMRAAFQRALFGAVIHAAHARGQVRASGGIEPVEFAFDLQGQFAGRGHDQREGFVGVKKLVLAAQHLGRDGKAKGYGLARASLCRDQKVAARQAFGQNGGLNGGQGLIALVRQSLRQRRGQHHVLHVCLSKRGRP